MSWTCHKLLPAIARVRQASQPVFIVIDNAQYHKSLRDGIKPLSQMNKPELINFISQQGGQAPSSGSGHLLRLLKRDYFKRAEEIALQKKLLTPEFEILCEQHDIGVKWLPPYSPFFSAVELLWGVAKRKVAETYRHDRSLSEVKELLETFIKNTTTSQISSYHRHVQSMALKYIQQHSTRRSTIREFEVDESDDELSPSEEDVNLDSDFDEIGDDE